MALLGQAALQGFSELLGDWYSSATTSASSSGTTIIDTGLQQFGEDELKDGFVRITFAGTNLWAVRRVTGNITSTITVAPAFAATPSSGDTYEFHRHDPRLKFKALDRARIMAYPQLAILRLNETLTGDGENNEILIPSNLRKGPVEVWEETFLAPSAGWNAVRDPHMNTLATTWTAAGATASLQARTDMDLLVPKYDEQACVKLVGSGTYRQVVADSRLTAASAAGRRLTFGLWVFQRASSGTATVHIIHDGATATSSVHGGGGWEFLQVSATIPYNNTTLLTVGVTTGGAVTCFVQHAFLVAGDRIPLKYGTLLSKRGLVRDDTIQMVRLNRVPRRGYQLRFIGRDPLTSFGQVATTQVTRSMEVDEYSAQLLYAKAARALFLEKGWTTARIEEVMPYIAEAEGRFKELEQDFGYDLPHETKLDGWWSLA